MTLTLEIVDGPDAGRRVVLTGQLDIGRDQASGLHLADKLVSRRHARIRDDADGTVIEDLGSSNGTFVNDLEIAEPTPLAVGDKVTVGSSVIYVRATAPPAAADSPMAIWQRATIGGAATNADFAADEARVGTKLAGYRLEAIVGRGGMGVVYRAQHLRLGRKVALKLLPPELAANVGFRARFERESRLAAAIDHPHIIPLYDAGQVGDLLYLTMRFVDGLDLRALLLRDGPLSLAYAGSIVAQVGGALDAAHDRGLVHRDVKPANVLISSGDGTDASVPSVHCYLTDFGLTRDMYATLRLTDPGEFVGTIDYAAPEQIQGHPQGGAADQYALGCMLYECLTGHPPYDRRTELDVMWAHIEEDPPPIGEHRPDLPTGIDAVLARAMAKAPEDRYATCTAMASSVRALTEAPRRRDAR